MLLPRSKAYFILLTSPCQQSSFLFGVCPRTEACPIADVGTEPKWTYTRTSQVQINSLATVLRCGTEVNLPHYSSSVLSSENLSDNKPSLNIPHPYIRRAHVQIVYGISPPLPGSETLIAVFSKSLSAYSQTSKRCISTTEAVSGTKQVANGS